MRFEEQVTITTQPHAIFKLYRDVSGWSLWDPEVRSSSIDGPFVAGATGRLRPKAGPEARILLVDVQPDISFTVESRFPLCMVKFEHELQAKEMGTRVRHRVTFSGPLAPVFGWIIGSRIRRGLSGTLTGLKRVAEQTVTDST